jgi:hypothetical protein
MVRSYPFIRMGILEIEKILLILRGLFVNLPFPLARRDLVSGPVARPPFRHPPFYFIFPFFSVDLIGTIASSRLDDIFRHRTGP